MKRLIKSILRAMWRATSPLRRPVARKFDNHLVRAGVTALAQADLPALVRSHATDPAGLAHLIRGELAAAQDRSAAALHGRIDDAIRATHHAARALSDEMDLALGSVVRELARLQMQVEILQEMTREGAEPRGLSLVDEAGEGHYVEPPRVEERMKVG